MYCPTCGSENPDGAKVCEKCGASLTEDVQNVGNSSMSDDYEVEYTGVFKRIVAYIIDYIILNIVGFIVGKIVGYDAISSALKAASGKATDAQAFRIYSIVILIITIAYFVLMESSPKQGTLGKMLLGIKITDENGDRISPITALERYVIFAVFGLVGSVLSIVQGPPKVSTTTPAVSASTILGLIGFVYYIIILITMLSSEYKQGLHDKLAKTYVANK